MQVHIYFMYIYVALINANAIADKLAGQVEFLFSHRKQAMWHRNGLLSYKIVWFYKKFHRYTIIAYIFVSKYQTNIVIKIFIILK